ncbi:MAG: ferredoxin--NADP reductase [Terriglobia bacterium]
MTASLDKFQKIKITSRQDHAPDLCTIRVRPEVPLLFQPGQYATLAWKGGGRFIERPYSIVSSPLESEIEFFFELVPRGGLTPALWKMGVGDELFIRREAKGRFTFDKSSGRKNHFLAATVTGVAPFVSMVRTLAQEARGRSGEYQVVILHAASRSWELAYHEELAALARNSNWFKYVPTISRPWEDTAWKGEVGRIEDVLRKYLDSFGLDPSDTTTYVCGQPQMVENSREILLRRGFPKEFVRQEVYWVPKKAGK